MLGLDCGGDLPAKPPGEITNPDEDGDSKYDDNTECVWTITAEVNKVIEVQFYYLETEGDANLPCLYDYVQVCAFSASGKHVPAIYTPRNPTFITFIYEKKKSGECRGIPILFIFALKHRLWVIVRTATPENYQTMSTSKISVYCVGVFSLYLLKVSSSG